MKKINYEDAMHALEDYTLELQKQGKLNLKKDHFCAVLPLANHQGVVINAFLDDDHKRKCNFSILDKLFVMDQDNNTTLKIFDKDNNNEN